MCICAALAAGDGLDDKESSRGYCFWLYLWLEQNRLYRLHTHQKFSASPDQSIEGFDSLTLETIKNLVWYVGTLPEPESTFEHSLELAVISRMERLRTIVSSGNAGIQDPFQSQFCTSFAEPVLADNQAPKPKNKFYSLSSKPAWLRRCLSTAAARSRQATRAAFHRQTTT